MALAPPIQRDHFLFNGDLYVDVGNLNRHKRASVAEISEVLRPDLKNSKTKKNVVPVKDPVGHWYEAQLIHYGLPPSKDKARAKMRLLENLNKSNLHVPPSITAIEAEMKKDFAASERKAKAQLKAASRQSYDLAQARPAESKKRKASDTMNQLPNINVNINFPTATPPGHADPPPAKARKLQTARRGGIQASPSARPSQIIQQQDASRQQPILNTSTRETPKQRSKQTARRSKPFSPGNVFSERHEQSFPTPATGGSPAPRSKQTARRGGFNSSFGPPENNSSGSHGITEYDDQPATSKKGTKGKKEPGPKVKKEQPTVKKEPAVKKEPTVKKEPAIKKESAIKKEPKPKKEAKVKPEIPSQSPPHNAALPSLGLINGLYDIVCPEIEQNFDYHEAPTLLLTLDTPRVWGAYTLGPFSGILQIPYRPVVSSAKPLDLSWRGREDGEGQMSFGESCHGRISFRGDGRIEGVLNVFGDCEFQGTRRQGSGTAMRSAASMREEWEGYNENEYERENRARWGGGW